MVCCAQKPGLPGMAPSKWITFRTTHAPGKVYRFANGGNKTFTNEEVYVRAWIPLLHKKNFAVVLGPNYRAEQLEFKSSGENPAKKFEGWNLRTFALDLNSFVRLDSTSWLVLTSHINKTGNFAMLSAKEIPLNYTVSASYLKRTSPNKEIGAGVIFNKSYKLTFLPVFLFNYNLSEKEGIEIMLPKKMAWMARSFLTARRATGTTFVAPANSRSSPTSTPPSSIRRTSIPRASSTWFRMFASSRRTRSRSPAPSSISASRVMC